MLISITRLNNSSERSEEDTNNVGDLEYGDNLHGFKVLWRAQKNKKILFDEIDIPTIMTNIWYS